MNLEERINSCSSNLSNFKKQFSRKSNEKGIFMSQNPLLKEILHYTEKVDRFGFQDFTEGATTGFEVPIRIGKTGISGIRVDGEVINDNLINIWPRFMKKEIAISLYLWGNYNTIFSKQYLYIKTKFDNNKAYGYVGGPINKPNYDIAYGVPYVYQDYNLPNQWDIYDWESIPFILCPMPINTNCFVSDISVTGEKGVWFKYYGAGISKYYIGE